MKRILLALALVLPLAACSVSETDANRTLNSMGITQVELGGYAFWGCSEDDTIRTKFTGIGVTGQPVSGVLCGGFMKGTTVRFD